jgi:hypothetical protein
MTADAVGYGGIVFVRADETVATFAFCIGTMIFRLGICLLDVNDWNEGLTSWSVDLPMPAGAPSELWILLGYGFHGRSFCETESNVSVRISRSE